MRWVVVLLLLVVRTVAWAACESRYPDNCRILFNGGVNLNTNLNQCTEFVTPTSLPPLGKQLFYCKAGIGLCTVDGSGTERCTGGTAAASVIVSPTPPASPTPGMLWWDNVTGNMFIYYNDGTSSQWVPTTATAAAATDIIRSSLAPFPCGLGSAGIYDDVDCKQICVCLGAGSAPFLWCRSDTGVCGTNTDCCVGGTTTTTTTTTTSSTTTTTTTSSTTTTTGVTTTTVVTTTTSTTLANPAPDWTPSFTAVWNMEEASGTRVNAQGTTTRNLTETGGTIANNTTTFMQGVASLQSAPSTSLQSTDSALANLGVGSPNQWTCVLWARPNSATPGRLVQNTGGTTTGWYFDWNALATPDITGFNFSWGGNAGLGSVPGTAGTWTHLGFSNKTGVWPCNLYKDGTLLQQSTTCLVTAPPGTQPFVVGGNGIASFDGQLDEVGCAATQFTDADICRICSCGIKGDRCSCSGTSYNVKGRNAASCGSCTLPACNQATP